MKTYAEQGGTYHEENGYLIPDLVLPPQKARPIGKWGRARLEFLQHHRRGTYTHLLVNCQLNGHLADVNEQAEALFFRLVEQMKEAEGVTEELKATDQMRWVGLMNNIAARAREIVYNELIYV